MDRVLTVMWPFLEWVVEAVQQLLGNNVVMARRIKDLESQVDHLRLTMVDINQLLGRILTLPDGSPNVHILETIEAGYPVAFTQRSWGGKPHVEAIMRRHNLTVYSPARSHLAVYHSFSESYLESWGHQCRWVLVRLWEDFHPPNANNFTHFTAIMLQIAQIDEPAEFYASNSALLDMYVIFLTCRIAHGGALAVDAINEVLEFMGVIVSPNVWINQQKTLARLTATPPP